MPECGELDVEGADLDTAGDVDPVDGPHDGRRVDRDLEGHAGPGGGLLEDHAQGGTFEQSGAGVLLVRLLQEADEVHLGADRVRAEVLGIDEIASGSHLR